MLSEMPWKHLPNNLPKYLLTKRRLKASIAENNVVESVTNFLKTKKFGNHFPSDGNGALPTRNSMDSGVQCNHRVEAKTSSLNSGNQE